MKIAVLGSSGTIGRAVAREARRLGHDLTLPSRKDFPSLDLSGQEAVISCMASRTGTPRDAWAVDYGLNSDALKAALGAGVRHFILVSALCVQKPKLAFQHAKLAFERDLISSGLTYSIVRPTAFFKSLSGQVERVRAGKPFLMFGDGRLTACKPISDADLARFIGLCLTDPTKQNVILAIGGPGPALTPLDMAKLIGDVLGQDVQTRSVPPALLTALANILDLPGRFAPKLMEKAALARIGHYYATESMLVWNGEAYDAEATPEFGTETLEDHFRALAERTVLDDRGAHAVF